MRFSIYSIQHLSILFLSQLYECEFITPARDPKQILVIFLYEHYTYMQYIYIRNIMIQYIYNIYIYMQCIYAIYMR